MTNKIVLWSLTGIIVVLIAVFGISVYNGSKPIKLSESDIKITEKPGSNENEKIITVDAGDHVLFYSFDGGETFQTDNSYTISENKSVSIVLQDNERRTIGKKNYNVSVVADQSGPNINLNNVPSEIKTGTNIDINSLVTATDKNNKNVKVNTTGDIDTSKPGTYTITYTATDEDDNTTVITTEVTVTDETTPTTPTNPSEPTKVTYYRYRTKTVTSYACNYYNCDYNDHNQTAPSNITFASTSPCGGANNPQISNPCPSLDGYNCLMNMVPQYEIRGNVCYDKQYITILTNPDEDSGCVSKNGTWYCEATSVPNPPTGNYPFTPANSNYSFVTDSSGQQNCIKKNGKTYCAVGSNNGIQPGYSYLPTPVNPGNNLVEGSYYKKDCSNNEIKIDGYCHRIESYGTTTCPSGYESENGTCYKHINKTCSNTCQNVSWSSWSKWSTVKVVPSDTVQVETKVQ